jgi:pimeloyl-ACP methyl ester carboxylesterase
MSVIVVKEGLIHYEVIGRGKPLVFLHGWLGSWRYWVPAMEELSVNYRTYALDLWGFGDSDKLSLSYNVNAYVELLKEFLDHLGVQRTSLVGHALGGVVALLFAEAIPERVERVMGVSVPLVGASINRPLASFSGNGDELARLVARRASFPEVDLEARKADTSAIVSSMRSAMGRDLRRVLLPLESSPVLLVHGMDDPLVKPPQSEWLQDCTGSVRAILLNSTQHFPMLEEQNKFNRLLKDFLAGDDLASLELKEEWQRRLR